MGQGRGMVALIHRKAAVLLVEKKKGQYVQAFG